MFTGIVNHCGKILSIDRLPDRATLWIESQFEALSLGESIAVDGACLTVTDIKDRAFACEVSPETLRLTIAGDYQENSLVNLERPLSLNDLVGGHLVSGHIDQTVSVAAIQSHAEFTEVTFKSIDAVNQGYLIQKGSVTINGVSLTVNEVNADGFSVMLIPHTLEKTNLSALKVGQLVNIEFDMVAKLITKQLQPYLKEVV